ncbi:MAG: hypothetical protein L0Z49_12520 [Actinobacteria bacterium]|nr:hypothetical protein [Actinomycetota bacterium]MCI0545245.1 hypothetical protein [Actinomycetota bacterium]MCI0679052.1 hypothetical protein [Actinomycetota bacterium]
MPYRMVYLGLGLLGVAAIVFAVVFATDGEDLVLPEPLESVSPEPGDLVPPQTAVEIDLPVGYAASIVVDGWPITDAIFVEATGVYRWAPTPTHPTIQSWSPGEHTVVITWDTYTGLPDPGSFTWTFRVG